MADVKGREITVSLNGFRGRHGDVMYDYEEGVEKPCYFNSCRKSRRDPVFLLRSLSVSAGSPSSVILPDTAFIARATIHDTKSNRASLLRALTKREAKDPTTVRVGTAGRQ
jgi:hypothetical protein